MLAVELKYGSTTLVLCLIGRHGGKYSFAGCRHIINQCLSKFVSRSHSLALYLVTLPQKPMESVDEFIDGDCVTAVKAQIRYSNNRPSRSSALPLHVTLLHPQPR